MNARPDNWLLAHGRSVASQLGEDGIVEKVFETVGATGKWCLEFGAADGRRGSNTWNLVNNHGWSAVLIESDRELFGRLLERYKDNGCVHCLNSAVSFEGDCAPDKLFARTPLPQSFDLMCVDIDGNDYHVWDSVRLYAPRVVLIEFNPTIPTDIEFVQPRDMKVNQGSSLLALDRLARRKGYELVAATDWNALFVARELFPLFGIRDNSPGAIHRNGGKYETRLFQLFDGTLVLDGYKQLFWHKRPIRDEDIQVLPPAERVYPARRQR